jgi:hypothetical protein
MAMSVNEMARPLLGLRLEALSKKAQGASDCAPLIQPNQVECVLAEVDPDRGDGFRRTLRSLRDSTSADVRMWHVRPPDL